MLSELPNLISLNQIYSFSRESNSFQFSDENIFISLFFNEMNSFILDTLNFILIIS